ncbi:hypothetical protein M3Y97_00545600 [Aphelenchoides bicaudatus]|nr:hypothetical protein M3Y97_00545600 [Aphelenchoides bicaudatus]
MRMQLRIETLEEIHSEDEHIDARSLNKILSRYSSIESLDQAYNSDHELDKLSVCLSEASSDHSNESGKRPSLFREVIQAQLALWTLIGSIFYSYAWQQHRKKFLLTLFVVVPPVIIFCITISSLLTTIVIIGRIFSTPFSFKDVIQFGGGEEETDENQAAVRHFRTLSVNSYQSSVSGNSINDDFLPRPVCRKHSTSNGSLNQISNGTASPTSYNGINGKSPPSHRLSYTFSHTNGGEH